MRRLLLPVTLVLGLLAVVGLPAAALVLAERETVSSTTAPPGPDKGWHKDRDRDTSGKKGWDKRWDRGWKKGSGKAKGRHATPRRPDRSCDRTGAAWELGPPPWVSPPQQRG